MFKLLKNGHCLVPEDIGINDIIIAWNKICGFKPNISPLNPWDTELIDYQGCFICPGIIDYNAPACQDTILELLR